jgi:predicted nucleic acid-binding Zn ribbon protein
MARAFCKKCGNPVRPDQQYCLACGTSLKEEPPEIKTPQGPSGDPLRDGPKHQERFKKYILYGIVALVLVAIVIYAIYPRPFDPTADIAQLTNNGFGITTPFSASGTSTNGYPLYSGSLTKDGVTYSATIEQTGSSAHATTELTANVAQLEGMGYTGSYSNPASWVGQITVNGQVGYAESYIAPGNTDVVTVSPVL